MSQYGRTEGSVVSGTSDTDIKVWAVLPGAAGGAPPNLRRAFLFQPGDTAKYLAPEKLSPELPALGEHVGQGNPLRRIAFLEEDKRWTHMSVLARSSIRLAAYAGALTNLALQADDLQVSPEDRAKLIFQMVKERSRKERSG